MILSSTSNERIKHARRVRDGDDRSLLFVEGERLVAECLEAGLEVSTCFHSSSLSERGMELVRQMADLGYPLWEVEPRVLSALADTVTSQGLIVLARRPVFSKEAFLERMMSLTTPLLLALDRIQDPGNLGTLLRTAEAAGVAGVVLLNGTADPFSPKALRASMGAALRLPMLPGVDGEGMWELRRELGLQGVAACADAAVGYRDFDWARPTLLVLGNEGAGVSAELLERCERRVSIPMEAGVESLNVAVAGGVLMFEAAHQKGLKPSAGRGIPPSPSSSPSSN